MTTAGSHCLGEWSLSQRCEKGTWSEHGPAVETGAALPLSGAFDGVSEWRKTSLMVEESGHFLVGENDPHPGWKTYWTTGGADMEVSCFEAFHLI